MAVWQAAASNRDQIRGRRGGLWVDTERPRATKSGRPRIGQPPILVKISSKPRRKHNRDLTGSPADQDLWFQFEIGRACARGDASFGRVVRVDVGGESGLVLRLVSLGLHQIWCSSTKCWCQIGQCWPPPNMEKMVESDWRLSGQKCLDPT